MDEEHVGSIEGLQHLGPVVAAGERFAQRTGQLREQRGVEQKLADISWLVSQHLFDQVVQHEPVAAGELRDETLDPAPVVALVAAAAPCGQGGQLEPGGPPLGPGFQGGDQRWFQPETHHLVEERVCLLGGETQVCGAQLDQLAAGPQP